MTTKEAKTKLDTQAPAELLKWFRALVRDLHVSKFPQVERDKLEAGEDSHFTVQRVFDLAWRAGDDCKDIWDFCRKNNYDNPQAWFAEDILGEFGFRIIWGVQDHWVNFVVYANHGIYEGLPQFNIANNPVTGVDFTSDMRSAEVYLKGSIKWDGCSDVHFGYHHWCGPGHWARHVLLLQYLYTQAFVRMRRDAEDDHNHWQLDMNKSPAAESSDGFESYQTPMVGIELLGIDSTLLRDSYDKAKYP